MLNGFFKILLLLFPPLALSCVGRISSRFLLRMVPWSQGLSLHKRGKWGRVPSPERGSNPVGGPWWQWGWVGMDHYKNSLWPNTAVILGLVPTLGVRRPEFSLYSALLLAI